MDVIERMRAAIAARGMADADTPVLLMVSGGSDSTALAYAACELAQAGEIGMLAMLHVNHHLRGEDADADAAETVKDVAETAKEAAKDAAATAEEGAKETAAEVKEAAGEVAKAAEGKKDEK